MPSEKAENKDDEQTVIYGLNDSNNNDKKTEDLSPIKANKNDKKTDESERVKICFQFIHFYRKCQRTRMYFRTLV